MNNPLLFLSFLLAFTVLTARYYDHIVVDTSEARSVSVDGVVFSCYREKDTLPFSCKRIDND